MGFFEWLTGEEPSIFEQMFNYENSGQFGEYLTKYLLSNSIGGYGKTLSNIYIPYKGKTSEIDVLLIHEKGIYVIESKNYSGWIFGSEEQKYWTQCLANKQKNKFYNPVMQNKTHINALSKYLNIDKEKIQSIIVFSQRCELKKVPDNTDHITITKRDYLGKRIKEIISNSNISYSNVEIDKIYNDLYPLTNVSDEEKEKHIDEIKSRHLE